MNKKGFSGEWGPLFISLIIIIVVFTIGYISTKSFIEIPATTGFNNPISSCAFLSSEFCNNLNININNNAVLVIIRLVNTGVDFFGLFNINFFSIFGLFPNNFIQIFISDALSYFAILPYNLGIILLLLVTIGFTYTIARLIRG